MSYNLGVRTLASRRRLLIASAVVMLCACASARAADYKNLELRLVSESSGTAFPYWQEPGSLLLGACPSNLRL
jgi:hypothetical protein